MDDVRGKSLVVVYSGGLDSTVLLAWLKRKMDCYVEAVHVNYGQRHSVREMQAALHVTHELGVPCHLVDLELGRMLEGNSLSDPTVAVPEGHYTDESMKATVVPNRNMMLLSIAMARAVGEGLNGVAYAAHAGDHPIYPDCRPEFVATMRAAFATCHDQPMELLAPFVDKTKTDIVRLGAQSDLGSLMAKSWSCYNGRAKHCGKCGTCVERKEAFRDAGVEDPTEYE